MNHLFTCRVYYEDTDLGGVVYYANYLRFIERARTEFVRNQGLDQGAMRDAGMVFVVTRIEADYLAPARFEDDLTVVTKPISISGVRMVLSQDVVRGDQILFRSRVTIAAMTLQGKPLRLPPELARLDISAPAD